MHTLETTERVILAPWYNSRMADTEWITTAEAAELANYHPDYIRQLIRDGRVNARKFGPVWQVDRESVLAYVAEQEAKGERRGPKAD